MELSLSARGEEVAALCRTAVDRVERRVALAAGRMALSERQNGYLSKVFSIAFELTSRG